jgi:hypothetical protein
MEKSWTNYSFKELIRIKELLEKLTNNITSPKAEKSIDFLQKRLKHFRYRSKSHLRIMIRPFIIAKELTLLRYHRQSNGFHSAVKELFFT